MGDRHRHRYDLYTSECVLAELERAPVPKAAICQEMLQDIPVLEEPQMLEVVIAYYIENRLMPAGAGGDAAHLAMTSIHGIDFLLTWNCRHLANANKVPQIRALNARLGLAVPVVTTPEQLIPEAL